MRMMSADPGSCLRRAACLAGALLTTAAIALPAQDPVVDGSPVARSVRDRWNALVRLAPTGQVAEVRHLVLRHDIGELVLERGALYRLAPIGGRTVGAVFVGEGVFRYAPTERAEQTLMRRFAGAPALEAPLRAAVILFADSTAAQLARLAWTTGAADGDVRGYVERLVETLKGDHDGALDPEVLAPILNADTAGFFLAHVIRTRGDPLLFRLDHSRAEGVQLFRGAGRSDGGPWILVSQSGAADRPSDAARAWTYRPRLAVTHYRMDVDLREQIRGGISLSASATLTMTPVERVGPWLRFWLDGRLEVDSARWGGGASAEPFKAEENAALWVRLPEGAGPRDTLALTVWYHGDMIDRYGNFFYIDPTATWYPMNGQGDGLAVFDITYHSPARYPLVSIGARTDSTRVEHVVTTRWVTREPVRHATFNLGLFSPREIQNPDAPTLTVYISDDAHRLLGGALLSRGIVLPQQRNMSEAVAADITNSLQLFANQYGPAPADHFTVTEIPYGEGLSFPGMIDLSWGTFQNTSSDGFDQFFRAHEVAHQWWGNAVRPATYRDAWLSEGLATFAGLNYLQTARRRNDDYYRFLDQYREDVVRYRETAGLVAVGYRNISADALRGYQVTVYEKGAWIFHMLRLMMLDLNTLRGDRFNAMLADYYQSFRGYAVTAGDFQSVAERHVGRPLDWFFDQWVHRAEVPTYHVAWRAEPAEGGRFRVRFRVRQEHVSPDFQMPVLVAADLGGDRTARFRVTVTGAQNEYLGPLLPAEPRRLTFNEYRSVLAEVEMEDW